MSNETNCTTFDEILAKLEKVERQLSKTINLQTRIAKSLHLLPVSEKEERDIQITQRTNMALAAKVNDDLNRVMNQPDEVDNDQINVYEDILGNDFLGGRG